MFHFQPNQGAYTFQPRVSLTCLRKAQWSSTSQLGQTLAHLFLGVCVCACAYEARVKLLYMIDSERWRDGEGESAVYRARILPTNLAFLCRWMSSSADTRFDGILAVLNVTVLASLTPSVTSINISRGYPGGVRYGGCPRRTASV